MQYNMNQGYLQLGQLCRPYSYHKETYDFDCQSWLNKEMLQQDKHSIDDSSQRQQNESTLQKQQVQVQSEENFPSTGTNLSLLDELYDSEYRQSLNKHKRQNPTNSLQHRKRHNYKNNNQTKNIPKNFGKAIITFIRSQSYKLCKNAGKIKLQEAEIRSLGKALQQLEKKKRTINTIADIRAIWCNEEFGRIIRMLSQLFLRKYGLAHIFNSRISKHKIHIKYRNKFMEALRNPSDFNSIKDY